jgi:PAS domain S-box-containing protein
MPNAFRASLLNAICQMEDELLSVWRLSDLRLEFHNDSFARVFGKGAIENINFFDVARLILKTKPEAAFLDKLLADLQREGSLTYETNFTNVSGGHFMAKLHLILFEHNEQQFILQRIIDVNELREAILHLQQEKQKFEALFQFASMAIIVANTNGEIVLANVFAKKLFQYGDEMVGIKVEALIPSRFHDNHVKFRAGYNHHPTNRSMGEGYNLSGARKDGTEFPVEVSLGHYSINGETFSIAFIIDISRRREIEETMVNQKNELERINREIEQMNDELEEKVAKRTFELQETLAQLEISKKELEAALDKEKELSDLKSRFVSMASHEFRTPLSTILSSASLVAKYTQAEEQDKRDKHIQRIRSAVSNLTDILNEFLSIGRIEEGRVQANFSNFNMKEQIQLVCSEMSPIIRPGQKINYRHKGKTNVYLDLSLLRNVIINLVSNAIKFSSENSQIDVTGEVNEKNILISVRDYGLGIPDDDKKHLFERFFRAKNVTNIQGTGLGLHIVSKYVELMHGTIEVSSELEKGTEFNIQFPYEQNSADRR